MLTIFFWLALMVQPNVLLTNQADSILIGLGAGVQTMVVDGTLSASGKQAMQGMPFHAETDSSGAFLLTMGGPFGITAARMYAAADTFVMVNYLMQEVWYGNPDSPELRTASHLPIPAAHLMALMRGRVPGDLGRFSRVPREGNGVLFSSKDSLGVEYVLVDTTNNVLQQYQRKDSTGQLVLDVAFQDLQKVADVNLPHSIVIKASQQHQTASMTLRSVSINERLSKPLSLSVPQTFERRQFH